MSVIATLSSSLLPDARPARPASIRALTGLRAVAAIWVVTFHYRADIDHLAPAARVLDPVMRAGYLGVDLFFALSGFVLAYNYEGRLSSWRPREVGRFLRNRVARVWPAHLVTLHIDLILAWFAGTLGAMVNDDRRTWPAYLENLTMTHDWFSDRPSFNSPGWSISAEWAAYLAAPLLFLALTRIRRARPAALLALATYAALVAVYALWQQPNGNVTHGGLLRVAAGFTAGVLLERVHRTAPAWCARAALPWLAALLAAVWLVPALAGGHYWLAPALGLAVMFLALDTGPVAWLLSRPGFLFWGEASYCLYLTHVLVQPTLHRIANPREVGRLPWAAGLVVLLGYAAVLAAAAVLLHRLVELPARRRLRAPTFHGVVTSRQRL